MKSPRIAPPTPEGPWNYAPFFAWLSTGGKARESGSAAAKVGLGFRYGLAEPKISNRGKTRPSHVAERVKR